MKKGKQLLKIKNSGEGNTQNNAWFSIKTKKK